MEREREKKIEICTSAEAIRMLWGNLFLFAAHFFAASVGLAFGCRAHSKLTRNYFNFVWESVKYALCACAFGQLPDPESIVSHSRHPNWIEYAFLSLQINLIKRFESLWRITRSKNKYLHIAPPDKRERAREREKTLENWARLLWNMH